MGIRSQLEKLHAERKAVVEECKALVALGDTQDDGLSDEQLDKFGELEIDVKTFDEQAGMEAAINLTTAALIGGNMIHDVGYIEQGLTSSMEMMVASDEIIDMAKRILRGIPVDDGSMALDVIDKIGPGGHFLEHDHTFERFKEEIWRPKLMNRQNWEDWTNAGSKRYGERVHARVLEILETETEPLLDEKMFQELHRICELADARHKDEELDLKMFA